MADPSKTEKPTPKKRQKTRKEGKVAKSVEATSAIIFIVALYILRVYGQKILMKMIWSVRFCLENAHSIEFSLLNSRFIGITWASYIIWVIWPLLASIVVMVIIINVAQVGFQITFKPLKPNFNRLNPISGFKSRFMSKEIVMNFVKSISKISIATYIVYAYLKGKLAVLMALQYGEFSYGVVVVSKIVYDILFRLVIFFIFLAVMDYIYQKWKYEQDLKMTKEEVKEERKRSEGNPEVKSAMRRKQRQMARSRMMAKVPEADVVVTNPVHLAIALKYDAATMRAPVVVAKGAEVLAETIKKIAKENKVPVIENPPLAQSLYKMVDVDDEIPKDLFNAVAEILSYVHGLTGKMYGLKK